MEQILTKMNRAAYRRHNREFLNDRPVGKESW
jgi:hypothetical protein